MTSNGEKQKNITMKTYLINFKGGHKKSSFSNGPAIKVLTTPPPRSSLVATFFLMAKPLPFVATNKRTFFAVFFKQQTRTVNNVID